MSDWEEAAKSHARHVRAQIPSKWLISTDIPSVDETRDLSQYIRQFLSAKELEITEVGATDIVFNISSGLWKAKEVTEAFCHRAALAHQLVNTAQSQARPVSQLTC